MLDLATNALDRTLCYERLQILADQKSVSRQAAANRVQGLALLTEGCDSGDSTISTVLLYIYNCTARTQGFPCGRARSL